MPASSKAQQAFMGAELARKRAGEKTRTGMSESQLREYASTQRKDLPARAPRRPATGLRQAMKRHQR